MRINRVSDVVPRDEVMDLIQDFDALALKLGTTALKRSRHYYTLKPITPVLYLTTDGKLVPARKLPAPRPRRVLKSIVVGVFLVVAAACGVLIA
jgi:hypothetical protein